MTPYYSDDQVTLWHGDALDVLRTLPDASVDAVVTDPPAGIHFMGRSWDHHRGGREQWSGWLAEVMREAYRVAKPGAHALVWALPRTSHWTACGLEDAGWVIRDRISHLFASGFPKSRDVSKDIDRQRNDRADALAVAAWLAAARDRAGWTNQQIDALFGFSGMAGHWTARPDMKICHVPRWEQWLRLQEALGFGDEMDAEVWRLNGRKGTPGEAWSQREVVGERVTGRGTGRGAVAYIGDSDNRDITAPATDDARRWSGWGTALKPAAEDWWVARKPLTGTVASNVLAYGTGALNVEACRVEGRERTEYGLATATRTQGAVFGAPTASADFDSSKGRWPSNVVFSHAGTPEGQDLCTDGCVPGCPVAELDRQSGVTRSPLGGSTQRELTSRGYKGGGLGQRRSTDHELADGVTKPGYADVGGASRFFPVFRYEAKAPTAERPRADGVAHSTVKPLDLMRWLVRLVCPPGGLVLDPFAGSGTTAEACIVEGFRCVTVEREPAYLPLIVKRLTKPIQPVMFDGFTGEVG